MVDQRSKGMALGVRVLLAGLTLALAASNAYAGSSAYAYDPAGRLIQATGDDGTVITYSYDQAGNLLSRSIVIVPFLGGGQSQEANGFLSYAAPRQARNRLPPGTDRFEVIVLYGATIHPGSFRASLNRAPALGFNPVPGTTQAVTIPLLPGTNVLELTVEGTTADGGRATDRDRLTFIAP